MPLEGHYQRVNTPLRKMTLRERRVVLWGTLVTAAVLAALLIATAGGSHPGPAPGCIRPTIAGRTGGEVQNACGPEAVALCKRAVAAEGPWAEAVLLDCRARGIRFQD